MTGRSQFAAMPLIVRTTVAGSVAALLLGGLVGLVLGVIAYPPTAWFAVLEVGIPAALLGAVLGACVGVISDVVQKLRRH